MGVGNLKNEGKMKTTSIDLDELANQCFETWLAIKQHQMIYEYEEEMGKEPVGNVFMGDEINKLRGMFLAAMFNEGENET